MQIVGIGTEIVECVRIARMIDRHGELFMTRVFTQREINDCRASRRSTERLSAHFASKEAVWKCLAPVSSRTVPWIEIEIVQRPGDRPKVFLHGSARELAQRRHIREIWLSFSHCRTFALAYAVALKDDDAVA
jgi:holo-[acyl-carrier protein] synthase